MVQKSKKQQAGDHRKQAALKSTKYSRYLWLRYALAGFFFANLYWLLVLTFSWTWYGLIPLVLMGFSVLAFAEQIRMYGIDEVYLSRTRQFFQLELVVLVFLLVVNHLPNQLSLMFPVFTDSLATKVFLSSVWLLGSLIAGASQRQISLILRNEDKAYRRIKQLEKFV